MPRFKRAPTLPLLAMVVGVGYSPGLALAQKRHRLRSQMEYVRLCGVLTLAFTVAMIVASYIVLGAVEAPLAADDVRSPPSRPLAPRGAAVGRVVPQPLPSRIPLSVWDTWAGQVITGRPESATGVLSSRAKSNAQLRSGRDDAGQRLRGAAAPAPPIAAPPPGTPEINTAAVAGGAAAGDGGGSAGGGGSGGVRSTGGWLQSLWALPGGAAPATASRGAGSGVPSILSSDKVSIDISSMTAFLRAGGRLPVVLLAGDRAEMLTRTLVSLLSVRGLAREAIIVLQHGDNARVTEVIERFGLRYHQNLTPMMYSAKARSLADKGAERIAQHYKYALSYAFDVVTAVRRCRCR